jgi:thiol-disulfide isomerase/thioredoxin
MRIEMTRHLILLITSTLLLLLVVSDVPKARETGQAVVSNDLPGLSLKDVGGRTHSLGEYRGKIVVLNFWATWCKPCREELPILVSLDSRYRERGVEFIAASGDDEATQKKVSDFARKLKITFPVWVGAKTTDLLRLGLGDELPATAIIDRNGAVVGRILGVVSHADLQKRIEWLLGDRETPAPPPLVNNHPSSKPNH